MARTSIKVGTPHIAVVLILALCAGSFLLSKIAEASREIEGINQARLSQYEEMKDIAEPSDVI